MRSNMIMGKIKPTDVNVYYEDSTPYLDYKGVAETIFGQAEVHIPKMGLYFDEVEELSEDVYNNLGAILCTLRYNIYAVNEQKIIVKLPQRKMTKKQIEEELGYLIDIVEE